MRNIIILITLLVGISACKFESNTKSQDALRTIDASKEIENWTCIPGEKVGLITKKFSEADIIKAYGKEKVRREEIGLGEGENTMATAVYPDSDNTIFVSWKQGKAFQEIAEVLIENDKANWTTNQGIGMGTTLEELVKINGKDFKFAGFEWDYSGYTNDWQGGNISKNLTVFLEPTNPEAVYPDLLGDGLFSSNHPKAKAAGLKVRTMVLKF